MKMTRLILSAAVAATMWSCGDGGHPAQVIRLDSELASGSVSGASRDAAGRLFLISGYGELTDSSLARYNAMPSITIHRAAVDSAFADLSAEEVALGSIYDKLDDMFGGLAPSVTYAIISPFNQSVITSDSIIYIGLNHYLGEDYAPYAYFPDYQRRRKVRGRLTTDVAEALVRVNRPFRPATPYPTLLSRLIYEGAVAVAVSEATGKSVADVMGYLPAEEALMLKSEGDLWRALLERNLIYSTDPAVARRLTGLTAVSEGPGAGLPAGTGRYLGAKIVEAYLKNNPSATLDSILSSPPQDVEFLRASGY